MDRSSSVHVGREQGMEVAAKVINDNRGFDGRMFGIVFCDVQGGDDNPYNDRLERPDAAVASAEWLVTELAVSSVIGPSSSSDTQLVYQTVIEPNIPQSILISPSAAMPGLTDLDTNMATDTAPGFLWRTASSGADQAQIIADDMLALPDKEVKSVAIIREMGGFGEGVARAFIEYWAALENTSQQFIYADGNAQEREAKVEEVAEQIEDFDAILFVGQTGESRDFITQASDDMRFPAGIPIYFPQTGANPSVFSNATSPRLFLGVRATTQSVPTDTFPYDTFSAQFMERFGDDPANSTFSAHAYDATWLSALGAAWSVYRTGRVSGLGIAQGIRNAVGGDTTHDFTASGWGSAVLRFKDGSRIDVVGASGSLDFDRQTEETQGGVDLLQGEEAGTYSRIATF